MKVAIKLFAIVTVGFGLAELTAPSIHDEIQVNLEHSQKVLDSTRDALQDITELNDSLLNLYCPYEDF